MEARLIGFGSSRVLVARPRQHAFGILITDVLIAFHVARTAGTKLLFLRDEDGSPSPLLRLRCAGVRRLDAGSLAARTIARTWALWLVASRVAYAFVDARNHVISAALFLVRHRVSIRVPWRTASRGLIRAVRQFCNARSKSIAKWVAQQQQAGRWRRVDARTLTSYLDAFVVLLDRIVVPKGKPMLTTVWLRLDTWLESKKTPPTPGRLVHHGYDIRELSVRSPLDAHLDSPDEARGRRLVEEAGLRPERPFVVLHVREGSTKSVQGIDDRSKDTSRNAALESFVPAIDEVVSRGYQVVRIGDSSMAPLERRGVIDLATAPASDVVAQLWAVEHCRFFIAADSGPYLLSWLFGVPCLCVNVTNLLGVFPLHRTDRYLVKRVFDRQLGTPVPLAEMLTEAFVYSMKRRMHKDGTLEYLDNTPEEILAGVREMFATLERPDAPETVAQRDYRRLVEEARSGELSRAKLYAKTASAEVFLGEGRVVDAFAAQHLEMAGSRHA